MCHQRSRICGRNGPNPLEADLAQMLVVWMILFTQVIFDEKKN
jgi:hypothetical protein